MTKIRIEMDLNDLCKMYLKFGEIDGLSFDAKFHNDIGKKIVEIENILRKNFTILKEK